MSDEPRAFLDQAYGLDAPDDTRDFYANWADTYEAELRAEVYETPARCAAALAGCVSDRDLPLLDLGCGTGLSGEAFRSAGFAVIDGTDFSPAMLAHARSKPGLYRKLSQSDLAHPLPAAPGEYPNMAAVGVFSPGHAPPSMIEAVLERLPAGGCFVFSLNDHAMAMPGYSRTIDRIVAAQTASMGFDQYGPHLRGRGLGSRIVVLRKT